MLSAPGFAFAHTPSAAVPQNTGVSGLDHNVDRTIGRDADRQWAAVQARVDRKKKILSENPGAAGEDLSRLPDDSYRVMNPEERRAAETARNLHHTAVERIKKHAQGKTFLGRAVGR